MSGHLRFAAATLLVGLAGCTEMPPLGYGPEPTRFSYTEPRASGLTPVRPYPNPDDVCLVMREDNVTSAVAREGSLLIGCPKHETGAIGDRIVEDGAQVVAHARHWTLLSVPQ